MKLAAVLAVLLLGTFMTAQQNGTIHGDALPDAIFINGNIYAGAGLPRAEAIAVRDGRIVAVGSKADVMKHKTKKTEVIDLHGKFVMPGFNDAHLHMANGGFEQSNVNLVGSKSLAEMQQRIADRVKTSAHGEWVVGRGWDHTMWPEAKLPTRQELDKVTGEHPAIFTRVDGHIAIANTAALKAAGVTRETKPLAGGAIDHDAQGEPTGILREGASEIVWAHAAKPTPAQRRKALELAVADAGRWGITSVQDNSSWEDFLVFEDMEREGKLTVRVSEWLMFDMPMEALRAHRASHPATDPLLSTGMLKAYMDGSLGSRTAALLAPYADEHGNSGLPQYDQAKLNQMGDERAAAGFQFGFHAIGDKAVAMALDTFAEADRYAREHQGTQRRDDFRFRIEHDQVVAADQIARYKALGVIASVQPNHLLTDMNWAEERIGPERAKHSYPWRDFLKAGVPLAFGTDYPVEPITPFRGVYAAVTRKNEAGTKSYYPEQKLTIEEAIAAYTTGAAFAEFKEKEKGSLEPGKLADFVVLDRDLLKVPAQEILGTKVLRTVVGGKSVYGVE